MNDDLISLSDESYYHGSAVIMGDPSYMKVIVENSYDIPFWQDFLDSFITDKNIDISSYENDNGSLSLTNGKAHIYRMSREGRLGPHYIGCVDADYDFLLGSHTDEGRTLQTAKYIIHTFAYSIENLICCHKGFGQVCTQTCKCQAKYPFEKWMNDLANVIYPLLLWALYLDSRDDEHDVFSACDWAKVFPHGKTYTQSDTAPQEIVEEVKDIVDALVADIESKMSAEDFEKKDNIVGELVSVKNLQPQDSLMYVRGHDLYGFVRDMMLKAVCQKEKNKHLFEIDSNAGTEEIKKNLRNQYLKQVQNNDPGVYLDSNYCYKKAWPSVYDKMKELYQKSQQ